MAITTNPVIGNIRTPATPAKLLEASGLQLSVPATENPLPAPAEKISLRSTAKKLNDAEQAELSSLKARDNKVRQHVQAHFGAGAGLNISSPALVYQRGADGVNYAVGGDVRISTATGGKPEDRLAHAEMIMAAALAPADPSAADRSAASSAQHMAQQARADLLRQDNGDAVKHAYGSSDSAQPKPGAKKIDTFV